MLVDNRNVITNQDIYQQLEKKYPNILVIFQGDFTDFFSWRNLKKCQIKYFHQFFYQTFVFE